MCELICDVINCCVLSCDTGKLNASDKIMFENQKKFTRNSIEKTLRHRIHSLLRRADVRQSEEALTPFTVSDVSY